MSDSQLGRDIERRLAHAGRVLAADQIDRIVVYLELLARWNRKINLTSLPVDPPADETLDRLIVEPVLATSYARPDDRRVLDVGSGGGSPALPFQIASRIPRLIMIEARERKSAFLREAARQLGIDAVVLTGRAESYVEQPNDVKSFGIITLRAVDVTMPLATWMLSVIAPGGRVLWFHSSVDRPTNFEHVGWHVHSSMNLTGELNRLTAMTGR